MITSFGKVGASVIAEPAAWVLGCIVGIITFLVEPGAAFFALWIVVVLDLISRLIAESVNHEGFFNAVKNSHIQSDKVLRGTAVKITAYFFMCVIAVQSAYIFPWQTAAELFGNIVYSILFFVEVLSIAENFTEAGVKEFNWLRRFTKRKLEQIVEDGEITYTGGDNSDKPPV